MYRKQILIVIVLVALSATWLFSQAQANGQTTRQSSNPSIVERIDNFGQNLVGGIFARKSKTTNNQKHYDEDLDEAPAPRAGSAIGQTGQTARTSTRSRATSQESNQRKELFPLGLDGILPGTGQNQQARSAQPVAPRYEEYPSMSEVVGRRQQPTRATSSNTPTAQHQQTNQWNSPRVTNSVSAVKGGVMVRNTTIPQNQPTPTAAKANPQSTGSESLTEPLHERLERFRKSVFGANAPSAPTQATQRRMPTENKSPQPTRAATPSLARQTPTLAPPQEEMPTVAQPQTPRVAVKPKHVEKTVAPAKKVLETPQTPLPMAVNTPDQRVLLARRSPILNVRTLGPARIAVGKNSTYEVHIDNSGDVAADDVVVTIDLPEWADVAGREASNGAILSEKLPNGGAKLFWKIGRMEAKARHKATLGIIPRQSRPIDLAVRWDFTPVVSQTVIEVEEPKLSLRLGGPREVKFGESQIFKLEITNSGNGVAEDLVLTMMPLVQGEGGPTQHRLGNLAAGEDKVIDMELTARQSGTLTVQMELRCDGPAKASLSEALLVRKPNVELTIDAPKMQFTGTVATYRVHVRNTGNATAEKVSLSAKIPPEAKLIAANQQGKAAKDGKRVEWTLDQLPEGAERELVLQCRLGREGYAQLKAEVLGKKVAANATAVTRVESIADLALTVDDPSGPVPLGEKAHYTIVIHNRGTKDATNVEAIVYFSQGIEPVVAEGAGYKLKPGQVVFDSIGVVPAGKKIKLKVAAQAQRPGNHMFRAEVYCRPLGTKLVSEETTHFYQGDNFDMRQGSPRTMLSRGTPPTDGNPARTADQRNTPTEAAPAQGPTQAEPVEPMPMRY